MNAMKESDKATLGNRASLAAWFENNRYVLLLVAIAVTILTLGTWLKPKHRPMQTVLSEAERLRLQTMTQRRTLQDLTAYFERIANNAARHIVRLESVRQSGTVWDESGLVVTALPRDPGGKLRVVPGIALATAKTGSMEEVAPVRQVEPGSLKPGSWIVHVSRGANGQLLFSEGFFGGVVTDSCLDQPYQRVDASLALSPAMLGGGLFDLDGGLVAVILSCNGQAVAVAAGSVQAMIEQANTPESRLVEHVGIRVTPMSPSLQAYFGAKEGAVITEVWDGTPASRAGLSPGDIVVKLDGESQTGPEGLIAWAQGPEPPALEMEVLRRRRAVKLRLLLPGSATGEISQPSGAAVEEQVPMPGCVVGRVAPGSLPQRAGVRPGDRILEASGIPLRPGMQRFDAAVNKPPTYLVVQRGQRKFGVFLE